MKAYPCDVFGKMVAVGMCHLLTPVKPMADKDGWTALQYSSVDHSENVVLACKLAASGCKWRVTLEGLCETASYKVVDDDDRSAQTLSGAELMSDGLEVEIESGFEAKDVRGDTDRLMRPAVR